MTIGTRLFTWMRGEAVGEDEFGNRYYQERRAPTDGRRRRR
ncbi:MAG: NADH:ubiquinone oxidoreductase subunit NDUFA12, partial [Proteobacteria bacterium]|nr:NADH:ubiquinone oxidoreductase subunit NDUFA12 [Pseudomonadota bacterium]